ncbi:hypothetical protein K432DRAFT_219228 [Lepidopterella palustris CBS 459.81]|uniref:Uncharacterized protein n=1 Tax=Lepidopterella palustris CBS 459.81 TaxID=1314670 RepID=A0A8E2EES6_9PEZI|nr:hypothetical protein K432DRAFT_219228 [Lepidopterella palustris CBS 459.81]
MGLKRKRSCSNSSPLSISSFATSTSCGSQSPTPASHLFGGAMDVEIPVPSHPISLCNRDIRRLSSSDLNSRTRKRFRDNRPDESILHETTIEKLFSAQRQFPHAAPIPSQPQPSARCASSTQKSTLHSFWALPVTKHHTFNRMKSLPIQNSQLPRCEDCDNALQSENEMDMDLDDSNCTNQFACQSCGRNICGTCAVVTDTRNCLHCTTIGRRS